MASHLEIELPYSYTRLKVWLKDGTPSLCFTNSLIEPRSTVYLYAIIDALRDRHALNELRELLQALSHRDVDVFATYDQVEGVWSAITQQGKHRHEQLSVSFRNIWRHMNDGIIANPDMPDTVRFALMSYRNRSTE